MSGLARALLALSVALYRALLRVYPESFRQRFGLPMEQLFRDACRDALRHPGIAGVAGIAGLAIAGVWRRTLWDLAATAPAERLAAAAERRPRPIHPRTTVCDPQSGREPMGTLVHDLRYAVRLLVKSPGFTAVVVLSLALGIGANSAIYSIVDGVVFNPFPYPEPDRLMAVGVTFPKLSAERRFIETISPLEIEDVRAQSRTLEKVMAFDLGNRNLSGGDAPERVFTAFVWGDPFATLGMRPLHGRGFLPEETAGPGAPVAVLSHRIWTSRFGADPDLVGRTVAVNGQPRTVVGIMPPRLLLAGADLWIPVGAAPAELPRNMRNFALLARLAPGVTLEEADAELAAIAGRIAREHGAEFEEYEGWRLEPAPLAMAMGEQVRPAAFVVLGAVGMVLLIACANIASLLLARAASRQREIAVRRALGAGRGRIVRQLLTESLLLGVAGSGLGLVLAWLSLDALAAVLPAQLAQLGLEVGMNGRVLAFTLALGLAAGLLFGSAPALQAALGRAGDWMRGGVGNAGGRSGRRLRHAFLVAEMALALVLLAGAGLLLQSFGRLQRVDPGFATDRLLTMRLTLPQEKYQGEAIAAFFGELVDRVEAIPGVRAAGATSQLPPMNFSALEVVVDGRERDASAPIPTADATIASPGYFTALGARLVAGRLFDGRDTAGAPGVALINETAVRRLFPGESPLGRRLKVGGDGPDAPWVEVVGVVADVRNHGLAVPPEPEVFAPVEQVGGWWNQLFLVVRTEGEPAGCSPRCARPSARSTRTSRSTPSRRWRSPSPARSPSGASPWWRSPPSRSWPWRWRRWGSTGSCPTRSQERTREIGIRMALGARAGAVVGMVMRQVLRLLAVGLVLGLAGALALGRTLFEPALRARRERPGDARRRLGPARGRGPRRLLAAGAPRHPGVAAGGPATGVRGACKGEDRQQPASRRVPPDSVGRLRARRRSPRSVEPPTS